jgi:hypothetical protein
MKGVDGNILKTCEPSREACFPDYLGEISRLFGKEKSQKQTANNKVGVPALAFA